MTGENRAIHRRKTKENKNCRSSSETQGTLLQQHKMKNQTLWKAQQTVLIPTHSATEICARYISRKRVEGSPCIYVCSGAGCPARLSDLNNRKSLSMSYRQLRWLYRWESIQGGDIRRIVLCVSPGHVMLRSTQEESKVGCSEEKMFLFGASRSSSLYCCTYHAYRIVVQYPGICQVPNTGTYRRGLCPFGNRKRRTPLFVWTRMNLGLLFHALVGVHHTVVGGHHFSVDWRS